MSAGGVTHLVQFSTGVASAEVAWRVVAEHGAENVTLLTADTRVEDEDNWRFGREVVGRLGCEWVILADGRTPMEVGRDRKCVPNNRMAVCSQILKRELLNNHIAEKYEPAETIIYLGYDWTEDHRVKAARSHWEPWTVEFPLTQAPHMWKEQILGLFRERGIEPPRLYGYGFQHANCGGACVRGGQAQWSLLLQVNRTRYLDWEAEEETSREQLGKDVSILRDRTEGKLTVVNRRCACAWGDYIEELDDGLEDAKPPAGFDCPACANTGLSRGVTRELDSRPLSLRSFRERIERQPSMFDADDWGACGCLMDGPAPGPETRTAISEVTGPDEAATSAGEASG